MNHLKGVILTYAVLGLLGECSQLDDTYDVLALLPLVSPRNHQYDEAVLMALARQGHRVTVYSQFPPVRPHPRYRHVRLDGHYEPDHDYFDRRWDSLKLSDHVTIMAINRERFSKSGTYVKNSLQFKSLVENIKSGKEHYDVVITEPLDGQEHLLLIAYWANAPIVVLEPVPLNINTYVQYVLEPSTIQFGITYVVEKLLGAISPLNDLGLIYIYYLENANKWLQSNYRDSPLVWSLVNTTPILTYTNDMVVKNVEYPTVRVSGIHIDRSPPPLSEDLQLFLKYTERGIVVIDIEAPEPEADASHHQPYFLSLRSLIRSLPGRVVWTSASIRTYSGTYVRALPRIPQRVLEQRKCKLLIMNGDMMRVQEAIYYGVPLLVVPQTSFQQYTATYIKAVGMGEVMDPVAFKNPSNLLVKVHEMLQNKRYKERALNMSSRFRSEISGLEEVVHDLLVETVPTKAFEAPIYNPITTPQSYLFQKYLYLCIDVFLIVQVYVLLRNIFFGIPREIIPDIMEYANGQAHMIR